MDIVIYTNPEILLHKQKRDHYCWWTMKRHPKNVIEGDRIYFAIKGELRGSFKIEEVNPGDERTILWHSNTWVDVDEIREEFFCKPFRGFRYRWWD